MHPIVSKFFLSRSIRESTEPIQVESQSARGRMIVLQKAITIHVAHTHTHV